MLSLDDSRALERWEDSYLEDDREDYIRDEDGMYLRADDEAEERFFEKLREGDL